MNAPQEFQGTSGEVTVPASAASRDRLVGARPRFSNSTRNTRAGSTSAMYWSPAKMFSPSAFANTVKYSRPVVVAAPYHRIDQALDQSEVLQQGAEGHRADDQPQREQHAVHAAAREQPIDVADSRNPS